MEDCIASFRGRKVLDRGGSRIPSVVCDSYGIFFQDSGNYMSKRDDFSYHCRCNHLKLNHLIFADDSMLFCKGEVKYVVLMIRAMKAFSEVSGLSANNDKTSIYFWQC